MVKKPNTPLHQRVDIKSYPYTDCREQHVWRPYDGTVDNKAGVAYRVQKCAHCPTKKHTILSLHKTDYGQVIRSYYNYPTDYRVEGGMNAADRGLIRMHNFLRDIKA